MQNNRFVVLTGHLNDYPLSDLIGILRHQRKTGRLLVEYPQAPASFYFQEGELVDAQLGSLLGLQAICVAVAQPASPFNFNPLIQPSRNSIDGSLQRVISELFGCWEESPPQIEVAAEKVLPSSPPEFAPAPEPVVPALAPSPETIRPALPPATLAMETTAFTQPETNQNRMVLVLTAAGIMMLGISSIIAVTSVSRGRADAIPNAEPQITAKASVSTETAPEEHSRSHAEVKRQTVESTAPKPKELKSSLKQDASATGNQTSARPRASRESETSNGSSATQDVSVPAAPATVKENEKTGEVADKSQLIDVVMKIENGRVSQAAISNHRSGMDGYEAMALRIARQRRYPPKTTGQEIIRIRVHQLE
jgi:hypothetical protein